MNNVELLEELVEGEGLNKLLSLATLGDGVGGELFETFIYNKIKNKALVQHIGIAKSKADLVIDHVGYSCKIKGKKASQTKIHHGGGLKQEFNSLKTNKDREIWLNTKIADIPFLFLIGGDSPFVCVSSLSDTINSLNKGWKKKKNENSITYKNGDKSINISNEYILVNKACFKTVDKISFERKDFDAYRLLGEMLK